MFIELQQIHGQSKIYLNTELISSVRTVQMNLGQMGDVDTKSVSVVKMVNGDEWQVSNTVDEIIKPAVTDYVGAMQSVVIENIERGARAGINRFNLNKDKS